MVKPFPLSTALKEKKLSAKVCDVDHYSKGLVRVDTDYIIEIKSTYDDGRASFSYM